MNSHETVKLRILISLLFLMLSQSCFAGVSKEEWLAQVKAEASVPICKSFTEDEVISVQMKAHQVSYDSCLTLIPGIAEQCGKKYEALLPATLDGDLSDQWGRTVGECIGNDFAMRYLYPVAPKTP